MHFCAKCGTSSKINMEKKVYECPKCGNEDPLEITDMVTNIVRKRNDVELLETIVITDESLKDRSVIKIHCDNCGNDSAYRKVKPPSFGDEDQLEIYECTKCKHTWRMGYAMG